MNNRPTEEQLGIIFKWLSWKMPRTQAKDAVKFIEENKTKRETSEEIGRLKDLWKSRRLTTRNWNCSEFWVGFEYTQPKEECGCPLYEDLPPSERIKKYQEYYRKKREEENEEH